MKEIYRYTSCAICIVILLLTSISCRENKRTDRRSITHKTFSLPDIPPIIGEANERKNYLTAHYWDNLAQCDTILLQDESIEQAFAHYIALLEEYPTEIAQLHITNSLQKMKVSSAWQKRLIDLAEHYLFDAGSPLMNESLYIPFAECALAGGRLDAYQQDQMRYRLEVAHRNQPGSQAADFQFLRADGSKSSLHQTQASQLLLVFYDPECQNCQAILEDLASSTILQSLQNQNRIKVLMIYTEGDEAIWQAHRNHHPKGWISGFDPNEKIKQKPLYDLRAMPSIYLLDADKKVIFKDVLPEKLIPYLEKTIP
ncbi:MAG: DUF5106 domain-containing protein [Bacteroidales bacterium]|nr:DUF5106 domain-containing protein [Bacteroidales bacterium]